MSLSNYPIYLSISNYPIYLNYKLNYAIYKLQIAISRYLSLSLISRKPPTSAQINGRQGYLGTAG